jgi:hypothetical protein
MGIQEGRVMTQRMSSFVVLVLLVAGAAAAAAQSGQPPAGDRYVGVWSGSWEGAGGSGGFELTLERDKDKGLIGKVSVTGEPEYKATLKSIAFDGAKMTAKYDFTPEPAAEVVLEATFDGDAATGTWSLREKGGDTEVVSGGWKVKRADKK